jgi:putative ABC transport system permease protein
VLAVFQLFLAVGAVAMTIIVLLQHNYLINKDRGYSTENIVVVRRPDALTNKLEDFKKQIRQHPGILAVSNSTTAMGGGFQKFPYYPEGGSMAHSYSASTVLVGYGYDSTYGLNIISGRFFSKHQRDTFACVINETAQKTMGIDKPVGTELYMLSDIPEKTSKRKIIGVVRDFNYETLENPIKPLVMLFMPGNYEGYLSVRLSSHQQDSTIQFIKKVWESYTSAYPFVYYYLDQDRRDYYKPVLTTAKIFMLLSIVNILMACLSLFALSSFNYNRRQREIGILKAMGASNISIMLHRTASVSMLILIASVAAWVGSYFLARYWLNDYANRVGLNLGYFMIATAIVGLISVAAIYYHTLLSARANPGKALKYE